jgi:hypothetical protein
MASWTLVGSQINGLRNGDQSALSTAVTADGNTIVVGSAGNGSNIGYVRVFSWNGSSWVQKGATVDGKSNGDYFGGAVGLSSDGSVLIAGSTGRKAVYVYDYNSGTDTWVERSTIEGLATSHFFSQDVKLTPDGTTMLIGSIANLAPTGYIQVWKWNGSAWAQKGSTMYGGTTGYGWNVDISDDGNVIIIGEYAGNVNNNAKVYAWNGSSWVQRGSTLTDGVNGNTGFGISVTMNGDGNNVAVSAPFTGGGAIVFAYTWNGSAWVQRGSTVTGGRNIVYSPDGNILSAGNYVVNSTTGAIYVYQWNGSAWAQIGSTINGNGVNTWFGFGNSVSENGLLVVGGGPAIGNAGSPGYVRVFKYTPATASAAVDLYANGVNQYITQQTTSTDTEKATVAIDIRAGIKAKVTNFSTTQKADTQLGYVDAMRAKGINTFTLPSANFNSFKDTFASVSASVTQKDVDVVYPDYTLAVPEIDATSANLANYLHIEIPINKSITLSNNGVLAQLTYDGSALIFAETPLSVDSVIIIDDKSFTIRGIGSGMFEISNYTNVVCMKEGTSILTPTGNKAIETLKADELIVSGDGRQLPIHKITTVVVVKATKTNAPYIIEKNAFGTNCPPNQLVVSPRHAIQLKPGYWEIPCEAAKENKAVYQDKEQLNKRVVYYHITLPNYETDTLIANGQITEALNDGKIKESYVWDKKEHGYVRNISIPQNILKK